MFSGWGIFNISNDDLLGILIAIDAYLLNDLRLFKFESLRVGGPLRFVDIGVFVSEEADTVCGHSHPGIMIYKQVLFD